MEGMNIVGADIVELAPDYDNSGASTAAACKVLREILLLMST
jgi:agmatinase